MCDDVSSIWVYFAVTTVMIQQCISNESGHVLLFFQACFIVTLTLQWMFRLQVCLVCCMYAFGDRAVPFFVSEYSTLAPIWFHHANQPSMFELRLGYFHVWRRLLRMFCSCMSVEIIASAIFFVAQAAGVHVDRSMEWKQMKNSQVSNVQSS